MLDLDVPDPGPSGPYGSMAWLRATVSRFANGATHARRRALVEARLRELDPGVLRAAAATAAREHRQAVATAAPPPAATAAPPPAATAAPPPAATAAPPPAATGVPPHDSSAPASWPDDVAYLPVAVLAAATGVAPEHLAAAVGDVRIVAAAYHPGTDAPGADAALSRLVARLPPEEPEPLAQHVALLVQACEATAGLVRGDALPVKTTKRLAPDGAVVVVDLAGRPFGEGRRACPGRAHALALADGVR